MIISPNELMLETTSNMTSAPQKKKTCTHTHPIVPFLMIYFKFLINIFFSLVLVNFDCVLDPRGRTRERESTLQCNTKICKEETRIACVWAGCANRNGIFSARGMVVCGQRCCPFFSAARIVVVFFCWSPTHAHTTRSFLTLFFLSLLFHVIWMALCICIAQTWLFVH